MEVYDSRPALTCSKLTIETLEPGVKYVNNKDTRATSKMDQFAATVNFL